MSRVVAPPRTPPPQRYTDDDAFPRHHGMVSSSSDDMADILNRKYNAKKNHHDNYNHSDHDNSSATQTADDSYFNLMSPYTQYENDTQSVEKRSDEEFEYKSDKSDCTVATRSTNDRSYSQEDVDAINESEDAISDASTILPPSYVVLRDDLPICVAGDWQSAYKNMVNMCQLQLNEYMMQEACSSTRYRLAVDEDAVSIIGRNRNFIIGYDEVVNNWRISCVASVA